VQFVKIRSSSTESGGASGMRASNSSTHCDGSSDSDDDKNQSDGSNAAHTTGGAREQTCYRFRQGESFGELALLMNYRRTGSVRAVSYVEMCILNRESFQKLLFKYPHNRRKVPIAILRESIKSSMLKDIQYPWKSLMSSYSRPSSASNLANRAAATVIKIMSGGFCKASHSSRCVAIFGDDWTVGDAAAALADKIDIEHNDDSIVFGNVAVLVSNFYANANNYQRKMESVFDTMNKTQLPHELRDRIHHYYEYLWREYECLNGDIVHFSKRLARSLELEVGLFKYLELVTTIPFWSECSSNFITHIVLHLDVRMYLPDDYVILKDETGN
jgi:hypothetical protein